ncbi:MAG: division/cell wall cluster transcriptional repressor MraZ [Veillonellaceae bacterium]|nr:division/cell wall cluster transcriptional repressor MraZ [Veillonellaceae bacterium]
MFMGEFSHTIDAKGRLIIPAKIREQLGESCVVTRGFDSCLAVYTKETFERMYDNLNKMSTSKSSVRALKRVFFGSAAELDFDKQGRILVPSALRAYASLEKDVVVVGVSDHIEIWSRAKWDTYNEQVSNSMEELAEDLDGLLL